MKEIHESERVKGVEEYGRVRGATGAGGLVAAFKESKGWEKLDESEEFTGWRSPRSWKRRIIGRVERVRGSEEERV